jgi:hypothetical protein
MKTFEKRLCILLVSLVCIVSIPLQGLMGAGVDYVGLFSPKAQESQTVVQSAEHINH